ncbi:MAG: prepilin-type N-terminal cleavage/methylation domain-containing protein [Opitutus sp.]|nr:prepilin-type N-terminal cleavage/methylation domain-containing protein [Opitutus sp.]
MKTSFLIVRRINRGFTMVEILMAVTILGLASIGIVAFLQQGLKMYYADRARLMINRDIRSFTNKMDSDAVTANFFMLYQDFNTRTTGSPAVDGALADGQVGDFLVLVYTDPALTSTGVSMVTGLVGYYREITNSTANTGPVRRFAVTVSPSVDIKSAPMYTILANAVTGSISSYPIVTQLAEGRATVTTLAAGGLEEVAGVTVTPRLFYNRQNRCVMVNAQISESLTERGSTTTVGNTYNFTVSPRG